MDEAGVLTVDQALTVLGLTGDAGPDDIRQAYRQLLLVHHPDVAGPTAHRRTVDIIAAYRTLAALPAGVPCTEIPPPEPPAPEAQPDDDRPIRADGDTLALDLPPDHAFAALLETAHRYGEVTYLDRLSGLFEVVVEFQGFGPCSVVVTLQGRATGVTEAFCCCEALTSSDVKPAIADVTRWLADAVVESLSAP